MVEMAFSGMQASGSQQARVIGGQRRSFFTRFSPRLMDYEILAENTVTRIDRFKNPEGVPLGMSARVASREEVFLALAMRLVESHQVKLDVFEVILNGMANRLASSMKAINLRIPASAGLIIFNTIGLIGDLFVKNPAIHRILDYIQIIGLLASMALLLGATAHMLVGEKFGKAIERVARKMGEPRTETAHCEIVD